MVNKVARYILNRIIQDTSATFCLQLVPQRGDVFEYKPGQFSMVHLFKDDGVTTWQKKAYSMSSEPLNREYLEFGIKIHGDFTQKMATLKEKDVVGVEGPYGIFTYDADRHTDVVMFAGGIGITPFISMIRFATEQKLQNKILLYYFNQTEGDISFKAILDDAVLKNSNLTVVYSVDNALNRTWSGEVGLITEDRVLSRVRNFSNRYFFMCGPMPFMKAAALILQANDVSQSYIKKEVF